MAVAWARGSAQRVLVGAAADEKRARWCMPEPGNERLRACTPWDVAKKGRWRLQPVEVVSALLHLDFLGAPVVVLLKHPLAHVHSVANNRLGYVLG